MSIAVIAADFDVMTHESIWYLSCGCIVRAARIHQLRVKSIREWERTVNEMLEQHVCPGKPQGLLTGETR